MIVINQKLNCKKTRELAVINQTIIKCVQSRNLLTFFQHIFEDLNVNLQKNYFKLKHNEFMKILILATSIMICSVAISQNYDKSAIVSELKGYIKDPLSYHKAKSAQQYRVNELESMISQLNAEKEKLNIDLTNAKNTLATKVAETPKNVNASSDQGTDYRVQLAVSNKSAVLSQFKNAEVRVANENGNSVYYITGFDSDNEAFDFSQSLRRLDTKGSFVTKYSNGSRDYSYSYTAPNKTISGSFNSRSNSSKAYNPYSSASKPPFDPYKKNRSSGLVVEEDENTMNTTVTQGSTSQGAFQVKSPTTPTQKGTLRIED